MPLKFRLIEKEMKIGKKAGQKLTFAQPVSGGYISFSDLCAIISDGSTVSSADVKAVFDRMLYVFDTFLPNGYVIDCGELGSFRPSFGSKGVEDARDFRQQKHMRRARVLFRPKKRFDVLRTAGFQRVDLVEGVDVTALPKRNLCEPNATPLPSPTEDEKGKTEPVDKNTGGEGTGL